jgi:hypothetical protein
VDIKLEMKGSEEIKRKLLEMRDKHMEALAAALYQEGFEIWREAVKRAPVEHGVLRNSAYVAPPEGTENPVVEVGFGTKYAVFQHERTELRHPRGGEAKFLERTVDERMGGFLERLAARTMENVKTGVGVTPLSAPTEPQDGE